MHRSILVKPLPFRREEHVLADARSALRASEERYRRIVETANEGVWEIDTAGRTTFMNRRMAQMLGCEADMGLGRSPLEFLVGEERARFVAHTASRIGDQREVQYTRLDGVTVWTLVEAAPILDSEGRPDGWFAMVMDISARKRAEATNAALESQLRQAQKMEAVGRLAGGIAHDFNNILTVILSCAEFLLEDLRPMDPLRGDVEEIRKAGKRAATLTRQLLAFSRQQVLEPRVVELAALTSNLESMLVRVLGEDVELILLNDAQPGNVRVDPGSIEQLIMNLVVNARDAMPTGGVLTLATASRRIDADDIRRLQIGAKPGEYVVLSVTDTGEGMTPATLSRIFEPFFTTKAVGKGTGLGLATAFGIVEQSNGAIHVESEPGNGTTFSVFLPLVEATADAPRPPGAALRGTETILLVEDEDQVRAVAVAILQRYGYRVIQRRSASEALEYARNSTEVTHLLLTDVVLPQMSGPELGLLLAAMRPGLRVLFMSGYTDDRIMRHGLVLADIAFLPKPFTAETLTRKVREVLDRDVEAEPRPT